MNLLSYFKKYILPENIDFVAALSKQSLITYTVINDLSKCFIDLDEKACEMILNDGHEANVIKDKNMHDLLKAFITPIDRESIYRAVTGLNWIGLSVKHFVLETKAYGIHDLNVYKELFERIDEAGKTLNEGFDALSRGHHDEVFKITQKSRLHYDEIVNLCIIEIAALLKEEDYTKILMHKEILSQLREIGKRIYIMANTLEDILVKMD